MQALVYALFMSVFVADALSRLGFAPRFLTWSPDLLSIVAVLGVVLAAVRRKDIAIGAPYMLLMLLATVHIVFGIIINHVPEGAIISGVRENYKYLPFFFLPTVYSFSQDQIARLLKFLLALSLMQLPLSLYQRFIRSADVSSGDVVKGSFSTGGHQSVFLICVISILLAFYLRGKLSARTFMILIVIVGIPTMLNETKATVFMLPIALGIPLLMLGVNREKIKRIATVGIIGFAFYISFFSMYQHFYGKQGNPMTEHFDFISEGGRFDTYLAPTTSGADTSRIGKVDRIILTIKELSKDPIKLMFGLGTGNMSDSLFGKRFIGEYFEVYGDLKGAMITRTLWENGVLGLLFTYIGLILVLRDAVMLKAKDGVIGIFSHGWVGAMCVVVLAMPYRDLMHDNITGYGLAFFCGLIVSLSVRQKYYPGNVMSKEMHQVR